MSGRLKKQKAFTLFIAALVVALIAGAVGFATGYGVNSDKRIDAVTENKLLREENERLSAIELKEEEFEALVAENEENKVRITQLEEEIGSLNGKIADAEARLSDAQTALSESEAALTEAESTITEISEEVKESKKESNFVGTITRWFVIGIIGVLILTGAAMILLPKFSKKNDDEDEEDDYDDGDDGVIYGEEYYEEESTEDSGDETEEIPVVSPSFEEEPVFFEDNVEQTEIDFEVQEEESEDASSDEARVPDTLEELMLESIKRNEQ